MNGNSEIPMKFSFPDINPFKKFMRIRACNKNCVTAYYELG